MRKKPGISRKNTAFQTLKWEVFAIVEGKVKFALWLTPEARDMVSAYYCADNCKSKSEFIEKAIVFYCGYLSAKNAESYLPRLLGSVLSGTLEMFGDRIGRLLFKQAVECNITNHLIAADSDVDVDTYERLRNRSLREVRETNGKISFKDDLIFQKSV